MIAAAHKVKINFHLYSGGPQVPLARQKLPICVLVGGAKGARLLLEIKSAPQVVVAVAVAFMVVCPSQVARRTCVQTGRPFGRGASLAGHHVVRVSSGGPA